MSAFWPLGIIWTAWHYLWRILPVWRTEREGSLAADDAPPVPPDVSRDGLQEPPDGSGPLFHRSYTGTIDGARKSPEDLMAELSADPNVVSPSRLAHFKKKRGDDGVMAVGDEFVVRMPGPWDGPIRVVMVEPTFFRFATLESHLEAGQIEGGGPGGHGGAQLSPRARVAR